ncbi:MAG: VWA domain-containing protein [Myxococcales bacterium]|nr:VWA domain-containing protein [Myxococcales bacterium]
MILVGCGTHAQAQAPIVVHGGGGGGGWIAGAPIQAQIHVGAGGETFVGVWIDAPQAIEASSARAPMALSLLVDTSGSMAGEKIQNAQMAAASMLESLQEGDIVSLYAFSSGVTELAPPTVLNSASRRGLLQRVRELYAGGGTNMWDGMQVAYSRMGQAPSSHPIRRIVVISDGQANIGPSDPASFGQLAANGTEFGAQISAIGVGLDYDERLLGTLAVRSAGRMYHLEHSSQMARILQNEIGLLSQTVATNAYIEIVPAPGVVILEGLSLGAALEDGRLRLPLGAVYGGQERDVLFRAQVPTEGVGDRPLATARLVYTSPGSDGTQEQRADLRYRVTNNRRAAARSENGRVAGMVASHQAVLAQTEAAAMLEAGRNEEAADRMVVAERRLREAAAAAPAPARRRMMRQAGGLGRNAGRARSARTRESQRGAALEAGDMAMESAGF